jgi:hypothetical protein
MQLVLRHEEEVAARIDHPALGDFPRWYRYEPHYGKARDGLAAARFTDQRESFSLADLETDSIHGPDFAVFRIEVDTKVVHLYYWRRAAHTFFPCRTGRRGFDIDGIVQ